VRQNASRQKSEEAVIEIFFRLDQKKTQQRALLSIWFFGHGVYDTAHTAHAHTAPLTHRPSLVTHAATHACEKALVALRCRQPPDDTIWIGNLGTLKVSTLSLFST
jgi:hypothetical protein